MSRWFRHYAGMMRDDKLVRVAIRSKQTIERVAWIWGAILESAAEIDDNGRYDVDAAEVAYFLRADQDDVDAIIHALADAGRVAEGSVVKWGNRQFSSDRSKDRVAAHRERKREERDRGNGVSEACNGDVTLQERRGNSPETELDTEEKPPVAPRKRGASPAISFPSDWEMPEIASLTPKAKACAEQWTRASYETVHEAFELHWRGSRKRRPDWPGTWCVWIIREHSKVMRDQKFGNAPTDSPNLDSKWTPERKAAVLERQNHPTPIGNLAQQIVAGVTH